jgi:preprotein translocase subunit Sss1
MENRQEDNQNKRPDQYKSAAIHVGIGIVGILGMAMYYLITK